MFNSDELDLAKFEIIDDDENADIYQQLARKDKYLALAAEAGKKLLEKNRKLESTIEYLNIEMMQKIEELEKTKYKMKSFYSHKETDYHIQLHNLRYDYDALQKELEDVKRNKKISEENNAKNTKDLLSEIEVMREKLEIANSKSNEFSLQVQTLKRRIEGRANTAMTNYAEDVNMMELKMAKEQIQKLQSEKRSMQTTLDEWASEKIRYIEEVEKANDTISMLGQRNKFLEQQISIAKSDLDATKNSNVQLREQLEDYILQVSASGFKTDNSLMSELESSLVHERETQNFDESMTDADNFLPISISSPKKSTAYSLQSDVQNNVVSGHVSENKTIPEGKESYQDLQRQITELNGKLNESLKRYGRLSTKYSLTTNRLKFAEIKLEEMQQKMNCIEREVDLYKSEREIIFSDSSLEDALLKSLEERQKAYEERNVALDKLEETRSDLSKLNSQLLEAVQQKLDLAEQLEMWQVDVAALIDRQVNNSNKTDRKEKSRSLFFPGRWSWTSVLKPS